MSKTTFLSGIKDTLDGYKYHFDEWRMKRKVNLKVRVDTYDAAKAIQHREDKHSHAYVIVNKKIQREIIENAVRAAEAGDGKQCNFWFGVYDFMKTEYTWYKDGKGYEIVDGPQPEDLDYFGPNSLSDIQQQLALFDADVKRPFYQPFSITLDANYPVRPDAYEKIMNFVDKTMKFIETIEDRTKPRPR